MKIEKEMTLKMEQAAPVSDQSSDEHTVASVLIAFTKSEKVSTQVKKWEDMFQRLLRYREKNGNCVVPTVYDEDPKLGYWVADQRQKYKRGKGGLRISATNTERKRRLDEIGFEWTVAKYLRSSWQTRFEQLLEFVIKNGHAHVPIGWEENKQLARWVSGQRRDYKALEKMDTRKGGDSFHNRLSQERMVLLNSVGFIWESQRGGSKRQISDSHVPLPKSLEGKTLPPHVLRKRARELLQRYRLNNNASVEKSDRSINVLCTSVGGKRTAPTKPESKKAKKRKLDSKTKETMAGTTSQSEGLAIKSAGAHRLDEEDNKANEQQSAYVSSSDDSHSISSSDDDKSHEALSPSPNQQLEEFPWKPIKRGGVYYQPVPVPVYVPFSPFSSPPATSMAPFGYPMNFPHAMGSSAPLQSPFLSGPTQLPFGIHPKMQRTKSASSKH